MPDDKTTNQPVDPTIPCMTLDLVQHILEASQTPETFYRILGEEMRELTGAKAVFLVQSTSAPREPEYRLLSVIPERRRDLWEEAGVEAFLKWTHDHDKGEVLFYSDSLPEEFQAHHPQLLSMALPLRIDQTRSGGIVVVGLPTKERMHGLSRTLKPLLNASALVLQNTLLIAEQEETIRHRTERLVENEERLRAINETITAGLLEIDTNGIVQYVNPGYCQMFGSSRESVTGTPVWEHMEDPLAGRRFIEHLLQTQPAPTPHFEERKLPNGKDMSLRVDWNYRRSPKNELLGIVAILTDITEQKQLEQRVSQSEKMDAIGQLAGGIAHDFNNQLAGVLGYADMLRNRLDEPNLKRYAQSICLSGKRAADLTAKLLAFARKGKYQRTATNMHGLVNEVTDILKRTVNRKIEIKSILGATRTIVVGDPTQLQNALLNLGINARDAMEEEGTLTFETACLDLDEAWNEEHGETLPPGPYLSILVRDSGCGMSTETQRHIFEPFFTTKPLGAGTGMGLPSVYGAVKSHLGTITVESTLGAGTTITVYLPLSQDPVHDPDSLNSASPASPTGLHILLVDDEPIVRQLGTDMLRELGHRVVAKESPQEALAYFKANHNSIDLVIADMIMPKLSGRDLYLALIRIQPDVKVIISSGYSLDARTRQVLGEGALGFLKKPYTLNDIQALFAEVLK